MQLNKRRITNYTMIIVIFGVIVYLTNYTILNAFLREDYTYSNFDGSYRFQEYGYKGVGYSAVQMTYNNFLKDHPNIKDKQLYRTFWIAPWKFWEWNQYLSNNERFKLPYISESKIKDNSKR